MKNKFNKSYFENYKGGKLPSKNYILKISKNLSKNAKVLDVGCGKGEYLSYIHKIRPDLKLYGLDIGQVGKLPDFIKFKKASASKIPFNKKFDFIFSLHVLEHVPNPEKCVKEFYRFLKKEGLLYIEMPYYKTMRIKEGCDSFWSDPTHLKAYDFSSIKKLLSKNGFSIVRIKIWRDWMSLILTPYLLLKFLILKDKDAMSSFLANIYGKAIGALSKKL